MENFSMLFLASPRLLCYGGGKLRKVYVDKAEARRQKRPSQARQQEAKVLKMCSRSIGMSAQPYVWGGKGAVKLVLYNTL